jgi:hypothetical protein
MAVITVTGSPVVGLKYTVTTASSADWASVSNSTYFYDLTDKLVHYKDSTGTVLEIFGAAGGGSIPQANKIYVDSINGVDSTARGNINNPYLTPEYALSDITNTGTFGCTTATSVTVSAISDVNYASISVGDVISGTGIGVNTIVKSKDGGGVNAKVITLSKATTTSASITATRVTQYMVICSGTYIYSSNLEKDGFSFDFNSCNVIFSGIVFNVTVARTTPRIILGGNWFGNNSASRLIYSDYLTCATDFIFKPLNYYSIGTGDQIRLSNAYSFGNMLVDCPNFDARFGSVGWIEGGNCTWNGYRYGLLGGIRAGAGIYEFNGSQVCPASINAYFSNTNGTIITSNDSIINGQLTLNESSSSYYVFSGGNITGTTMTIGSTYDLTPPLLISSNITATTINIIGSRGGVMLSGIIKANIVNTKTLGSVDIANLQGSYTGSSTSEATIKGGWHTDGNSSSISSVTLTGTASLIIVDSYKSFGYTTNGYCYLNIASGCNLRIDGFFKGIISSLAGTITNNGVFNINGYQSAIITGTVLNNNYIELFRTSSENSLDTPTIKLGNGGVYQQNGGKLICNVATSKSGLIQKTATNSKIQLTGQAYLKVANGLAPIQILSNTGTAQDVEVYSVIDNCAVGFRISDTFSDTTYGTAYAPNILVGGTMLEATTYLL